MNTEMTLGEFVELMSGPSRNYQIILRPQKRFKDDGAQDTGKRVIFNEYKARVSREDFEFIKNLPQFGVDFFKLDDHRKLPANVAPAPTVRRMAGEQAEEEKNAQTQDQINDLTNKIDLLTAVIGNLVAKKEE